tara:strand:+ start:89481 stop:89783 length:303 start_codon:yes stop_codon:yes gene_type:complete
MVFSEIIYLLSGYTLPFRALNTQAIAKKPIPTEAKPHPATSSYLKAPIAIKATPTTIIIKVAHANTVFLFIIKFSSLKCALVLNLIKILNTIRRGFALTY